MYSEEVVLLALLYKGIVWTNSNLTMYIQAENERNLIENKGYDLKNRTTFRKQTLIDVYCSSKPLADILDLTSY
jgi:hypothetical protein